MRKKNAPFLLRAARWVFPKLEKVAPFFSNYIFRLAFYVPVRYKVPEKEQAAAKTANQFKIQVAGRQIQLYSWGEESLPFVLLVHGWAGRTTQFRKFIEPLKNEGYRVIGFDGPAHGKSEGEKTSIIDFEQVLKSIFQKFGNPEAVITHSFGGAATLYAMSNGLPVKVLVNIATPYIAEEILKTFLRALNGTWSSAEAFKKYVINESGKPFEEFTGLISIRKIDHTFQFLIVQDAEDKDVPSVNADEMLKAYPTAISLRTTGLGHTQILKDDTVIMECVRFVSAQQR